MAFCAYCGKEVLDQAAACPNCGHPQAVAEVQLADAAPLGPRTEGNAIASLVLGIAGFFVCPFVCSILAIVLGSQARKKIRMHPILEGDGMAKAGVILGWVGIGFFILAIVIGVLLLAIHPGHRHYEPSI